MYFEPLLFEADARKLPDLAWVVLVLLAKKLLGFISVSLMQVQEEKGTTCCIAEDEKQIKSGMTGQTR